MNLAEVRDHILTELGNEEIDVELVEKELDNVIAEGTRVLTRYLPKTLQKGLTPVAGQDKYKFDEPGVTGIIDVQFVRYSDSDRVLKDSEELVIDTGEDDLVSLPWAEYLTVKAEAEDRRRAYSVEPDWSSQWEYDETDDENYLYLYIDISDLSTKYYEVGITYSQRYLPSDDKRVGIPSIRPNHEEWFLEFCLAKAKQLLGRKLRKFGNTVPDPGGSGQPLDGSELISDGKESERELLEDIKMRQAQSVPQTDG